MLAAWSPLSYKYTSAYLNMSLRVYLVHEGERLEYFIPEERLVKEVKLEVQSRFLLGQDDGKSDKKVINWKL